MRKDGFLVPCTFWENSNHHTHLRSDSQLRKKVVLRSVVLKSAKQPIVVSWFKQGKRISLPATPLLNHGRVYDERSEQASRLWEFNGCVDLRIVWNRRFINTTLLDSASDSWNPYLHALPDRTNLNLFVAEQLLCAYKKRRHSKQHETLKIDSESGSFERTISNFYPNKIAFLQSRSSKRKSILVSLKLW